MGHYSNDCTEKKPEEGAKPNPFQKATANHVNVEEVGDEPDLVMGKLLINSCTALVLFDTGASHSFISRVFVGRNKLPTRSLNRSIKVCSPGGEMVANTWCPYLTLAIGSYEFPTELIVLNSQRIDVILGMDWIDRKSVV